MTSTETAKPLSQDRAILLGLLGMIVVPTAIVVGTNSWTEPEAADWVRMALGSVIAALVSVVAAWWLAFDRRRGARPRPHLVLGRQPAWSRHRRRLDDLLRRGSTHPADRGGLTVAAPLDATTSPARPRTSGHRARFGFWTMACLGVPAALFSWCWFGFAMAEAQSEQGKALAAGTTMAGFGETVGGIPVAVAHVVGLIVLLVLAHRAYRDRRSSSRARR